MANNQILTDEEVAEGLVLIANVEDSISRVK